MEKRKGIKYSIDHEFVVTTLVVQRAKATKVVTINYFVIDCYLNMFTFEAWAWYGKMV